MVLTPEKSASPSKGSVEIIHATVPLSKIAELARQFILDGPEATDQADVYVATKALWRHIGDASAEGLTARDVVVSLLRPAFATSDHCRCGGCQSRCPVCRAIRRGPEAEKKPAA